MTLAELRQKVNGWAGQKQLLERQLSAAVAGASQHEEQQALYEEAKAIIDQLEQRWRGTFQDALASIVSQGLTTVFGEEMEVKIVRETKRGASSSRLTLLTDGVETPVLDAKGGSVVNVLVFLLRLLLCVSARPPLRQLLLLDEPFSHVSAEYRSTLCALLRDLADRLDVQLLIVSHEEELQDAADVSYLVQKKGGVATVRALKTPEEERV